MENTNLLKLPYLMANQAQKHVTHNEAIRALDALIQISVIEIGTDVPPVSPNEGDRYLVGETPGDEWAERAGELAVYVDGAWMFHEPREGWVVWDLSRALLNVFSSGGWQGVSGSIGSGAEIQDAAFLGINGAATASERLVVQSGSALFNHDGDGHRLKINKANDLDTASLEFQSGFSGRAEIGLIGQDNFSIKISHDGGSWADVLAVDPTDETVHLPTSGVSISPELYVNLLPDSGRFNPADQQGSIITSVAQTPGYIVPFNGALLKFPFKFINDNTTYGGSVSPLNPVVNSLIESIFGGEGTRFGPEFWTMKIEAGVGTDEAISFEGQTFYRATLAHTGPRPGRYTTGFFVKSIVGNLALVSPDGDLRSLKRDGANAVHGTEDAIVTPSDGWVYFEMQIASPDRAADKNDLAVYLTASGSCFFALPRVVPGWVTLGKNQFVVPNNRAMEL